MFSPAPIPVTVIGGFLGAGKTTLLNRILARGARRWGVLVNDFGALNIDAALIEAEDGLKAHLDNGCVCCSMADGLAPALDALLGLETPPEAIVIEASGVGDPWRIAELAVIDPRLSVELVLTLADASRFAAQMRDDMISDTLERQVRRADIVALTKTDLADAGAAEAAIRRLRPDARIVTAIHGDLPEDLLTGAGAAAERVEPAPHHHHHHADHEAAFARWSAEADGPVGRTRLTAALDAVPASVLRLKGFVTLAGEGPHLLQYVAGRWSLTPDPRGGPGAALVGIGLPDPVAASAVAALLREEAGVRP